METQKVHGEKLCKVWNSLIQNLAFADLKLALTPTEGRLHLPRRAALFLYEGLICQGQRWSKNWENLLVLQSWLLWPNPSVNEVVVLFCLEKGLGEVCSIPRLHCKCYCEFWTHPFLLTLCRRQFLRREFILPCWRSSGLSLLLVQKT